MTDLDTRLANAWDKTTALVKEGACLMDAGIYANPHFGKIREFPELFRAALAKSLHEEGIAFDEAALAEAVLRDPVHGLRYDRKNFRTIDGTVVRLAGRAIGTYAEPKSVYARRARLDVQMDSQEWRTPPVLRDVFSRALTPRGKAPAAPEFAAPGSFDGKKPQMG